MFSFIKKEYPDMNEELATMLSKHSKITTRKDIVNQFKEEINERIYNMAKLYNEYKLTIDNIPKEVNPYLDEIVDSLKRKGFAVGILKEPYCIIIIKWDVL